jgi:transcriptional regulator with XRE-family HTH domain
MEFKRLDHVTIIGDTTSGAFSDMIARELPNGWVYTISIGDWRDHNGISYEGIGFPPDIVIQNKAEDIASGYDKVLERAIHELKKHILNTHHSVIGKYERDDVKPSIDAVKRIAEVLETTIAYLLGEAETDELFKDPAMLKRLKEINALLEKDRECILYNLDAVLRDVKKLDKLIRKLITSEQHSLMV